MKIPVISSWLEKRKLAKFDEFLDFLVGGQQTYTGVHVTEKTALNSTAVFACVRILSETLASLPLPVYRRLKPRGKERAPEHPLYSLLHDAPNPEMTSLIFREVMQGHVLTWGNCYAQIDWTPGGRPKALWPLMPNKMEVTRDKGKIIYIYQLPDGEKIKMPAYKVFHVAGLGYDGYIGYSPIRMAQNAIGLTMAAEEFGSRFFGQGGNLGGVLTHPGRLSEDAYNRLEKSMKLRSQGLSQAHKWQILEEGMTFDKIGIPPNEAQFLETRKFQIEEIARIYRVPLHLMQHLERATNNNIEHQGIDFVVHTVRPWLVRWEQAIKQKLFTVGEREQYFAEFLVDGLLRGDITSRYAAYAVGRQWGWHSANDILELENQNPIGEQGDIYLIPMNMVPADAVNDYKPESPEPPEEQDEGRTLDREVKGGEAVLTAEKEQRSVQNALTRARIANGYEPIIRDAVTRIVKRDIADVRRAAKSRLKGNPDTTEFLSWLDDYYEKAPEWVRKIIAPVFYSLSDMIQAEAASEVNAEAGMTPELEKFVDDYTNVFVKRYVGESRGSIRRLATEPAQIDGMEIEAEPADLVLERVDRWEKTRTEIVSNNEAVRLSNAVARAAFIGYGISRIRWVAAGTKPCEFCESMDGVVVGIERSFLDEGSELTAGDGSMAINTQTKHPPLHRSCQCQIVPER